MLYTREAYERDFQDIQRIRAAATRKMLRGKQMRREGHECGERKCACNYDGFSKLREDKNCDELERKISGMLNGTRLLLQDNEYQRKQKREQLNSRIAAGSLPRDFWNMEKADRDKLARNKKQVFVPAKPRVVFIPLAAKAKAAGVGK